MQQFSASDVDQLRQLMHESLTSLAVEIGTQVACCLLEEDVVKPCGAKRERVLNRVNSRHGSQLGYVILGHPNKVPATFFPRPAFFFPVFFPRKIPAHRMHAQCTHRLMVTAERPLELLTVFSGISSRKR
jgi:hypothetical protein